MNRTPHVAVVGATGAVGQTFIRCLADHPWFRIAEVAASERSVGKRYGEATRWIEGELPADVAALPVLACDPAAGLHLAPRRCLGTATRRRPWAPRMKRASRRR